MVEFLNAASLTQTYRPTTLMPPTSILETWRACSATQSLSMNKEEESAGLDLVAFFLSGSVRAQAGSAESLCGVGMRSKRKARPKEELNLPIRRPT